MYTEEMQGVISKHTIEESFAGDGSCGIISQSVKRNEQIALHLKKTLRRPHIYNQAYHENLSEASPGNVVGFTQPSLLSLFIQEDKVLEKINKSENNLNLHNFWHYIHQKKLESNNTKRTVVPIV